MTALVVLPRQLVVDGSGAPRSGAKLYVYDAGTTTPRTSYTTSALSTAHANPVVSVSTGLFPAIYVNPAGGDYKLVLKDSNDVTIWTEDNIKPRPAEDFVTPESYGAVGDGVTNDAVAIQAAIDTGRNVRFTADTYFLGTANSGNFVHAHADGQVFLFENGSRLKANGTTTVTNTASIFEVDSLKNIVFINPAFESNWGVDADRDAPYAIGLLCTTGMCQNISVINGYAYKCQALVQTGKSSFSDSYEVENLNITGYADTCYYGTGYNKTGNHVKAHYKTLNAHRAYFPVGVHSHDVTVFDVHDGTVSGPTSYLHQIDIQATSFTGSISAKDTYNIRLRYTVKGAQYTGIPFLFHVNHTAADTKKGVLRDIHVTYNDRGTGISKSIGFLYSVDGTTTSSYTGTCFDRITIDGYAKNAFDLTNAGTLGGPVVQTVLGTLDIGGLEMDAAPTGANDPHNSYLFDSGRLFDNDRVLSFTPVIVGTSSAGTGTYTYQVGRARKSGRTVHFEANVAWTAHDGTGNITISGLPYACRSLTNYAASVSVAPRNLSFTLQPVGLVLTGESVVRIYQPANAGDLAAIVMEAAATLHVAGSYETN